MSIKSRRQKKAEWILAKNGGHDAYRRIVRGKEPSPFWFYLGAAIIAGGWTCILTILFELIGRVFK